MSLYIHLFKINLYNNVHFIRLFGSKYEDPLKDKEAAHEGEYFYKKNREDLKKLKQKVKKGKGKGSKGEKEEKE